MIIIPDRLKAFLNRFRDVLSFDLRSLALFRICLGWLLLSDLWVRAYLLEAHYTDFGMVPRSELIRFFSSTWQSSFHLINGTLFFAALLFLLQAAFALMLLLGYRTRLFTFLSWLMLLSLHNRNPLVLQAGDILLRCIVFFSIWLPLGARFSLDSLAFPKPKKEEHSVLSAATFCFLIQVAILYWFSVYSKLTGSFDDWWRNSTAVYYTLNIDHFATMLGAFLAHLPKPFLAVLTRGVILTEALAPLLLLVPFAVPWMRLASIVMLVGMHLGLGLSLHLGPFPWVSSVIMIPFLPALFWQRAKPVGAAAEGILRRAPWIHVLRDRMQAWVGRHPPAGETNFKLSPAGTAVCLLVLAFILASNVVAGKKKLHLPKAVSWFGVTFGFSQRWNMFSGPIKDDGWYIIPGQRENGEELDLYTGKPLTRTKPASVAGMYVSNRERKFMLNLRRDKSKKRLSNFGKYLCRKYNQHERGGRRVKTFQIIYMREMTPKPDREFEKETEITLWKHLCYRDPPAKPKADPKPPLDEASGQNAAQG